MPDTDLPALIAENARLKELVAAIVPWPGDVPLCGEQTPKIDQIIDLIKYLVTVHARWGNTAVQFRVTWGGSALWAADELRKEIIQLTTQRDELAKALEQIEQMGHYPADLAPDLIGDPERDSKLCDRLADVANDALARIVGNVT